MFRMLAVFISFTCLVVPGAGAASDRAAPNETADLVIRNVTVITMTQEARIENAAVVVRDGRITAIERGRVAGNVRAKREVDGSGKYLMPGLIDMHVHILTPFDAPLYPAAGVTTVRNMWGFPGHLQMRKSIAAGQMFGPQIVTAGRLIDGDPKIWPNSVAPKTPEELERIITEDIAAGYDFVKVYSRMTPQMFLAAAQISRKVGREFVGHVPNEVDLKDAARAGMKTMEHLWGMPSVMHPQKRFVAYDPLDRSQWNEIDLRKLDEIARIANEHGVWLAPTLLVMENIYLSGDPQLLAGRAEGIEYVNPATVEFWNASAKKRPAVTDEYRVEVEKVRVLRERMVKGLYDRKVRLLVGTDSNNPFVVHGFSIYAEMDRFVQAGVPWPAVLQMATRDAAQNLGMADSIGTLAVGKQADMLMLDADPTLSLANLQRRAAVIVDGAYHSDGELRAKLVENKRVAEETSRMMTPSRAPDPAPGAFAGSMPGLLHHEH